MGICALISYFFLRGASGLTQFWVLSTELVLAALLAYFLIPLQVYNERGPGDPEEEPDDAEAYERAKNRIGRTPN